MNRKDLLKLALVVVLSAAATSAIGAQSFTGSTLLGGNSFSTSNSVNISIETDGSGTANQGFDGNSYDAKAKHTKGDKTIGSMSGDPKLYFYGGTSTDDTSHFTASTGEDYTVTSVWTSM